MRICLRNSLKYFETFCVLQIGPNWEKELHLGTWFPLTATALRSKHQKAFSQIESDSSFICIHHDITDLNWSLKAFLTICQGRPIVLPASDLSF